MFAFSLLLPFRAQTFRGKRWEEEGEKEEGRKFRVWEEPTERDQIFACKILPPSFSLFSLRPPKAVRAVLRKKSHFVFKPT